GLGRRDLDWRAGRSTDTRLSNRRFLAEFRTSDSPRDDWLADAGSGPGHRLEARGPLERDCADARALGELRGPSTRRAWGENLRGGATGLGRPDVRQLN